MTHPPYLREKARQLRTERKLSLDEIAERLALPKTTVWYWIEDLPDPAIRYRDSPRKQRAREASAGSNREHFKALRAAAYRMGQDEFSLLDAEPAFRDFICLYIAEGFKRSRNRVAIANSDPAVVRLGDHWIRRFARNPVTYSFQHHADQDPDQLKLFWSTYLGVDLAQFRFQRKSNSGQLAGRTWRSEHGVLTVTANDTLFRARLQAWMDQVKKAWLDSLNGV